MWGKGLTFHLASFVVIKEKQIKNRNIQKNKKNCVNFVLGFVFHVSVLFYVLFCLVIVESK